MGTDPEQLKREIEQTRQELSMDADALTEKVSPGRIVDRRVGRAKDALSGARDSVMGSASSGTSGLSDTASGLTGSATAQARGNPLAAGLIAFGAGWLLSALIPASEKETQVSAQLTDAVKAHAQPVKDELSQIAGDLKDTLQEPAQQAVASVKSTAVDAVDTVKSEGQSAVGGVKDDATSAAATVKDEGSSDSSPGGTARP